MAFSKCASAWLRSPIEEYVCPITAELPVDPVNAEDGRFYERHAIEEWFSRQPQPQVQPQLRLQLRFGQRGGQRLAVMVNEFGSVGLDGDLIRSCGFCPEEDVDGRLVELNNGCLCCTVQDDFLPTMETLLDRADQLDGIVVETSGLALPRPLLQALDWPAIRSRVHVNGVVTLVDGEALAAGSPVADAEALERQRAEDPSLDHLTAIDDLFEDQLQAADLVLISRADRLDASAMADVKEGIRNKVRPGTALLPVSQGQVETAVVLGLEHQATHQSHEHEHHDDHHHDHHRIASDHDHHDSPHRQCSLQPSKYTLEHVHFRGDATNQSAINKNKVHTGETSTLAMGSALHQLQLHELEDRASTDNVFTEAVCDIQCVVHGTTSELIGIVKNLSLIHI